MGKKSTITVDVSLDEQKVPEAIEWSATDSTAAQANNAKAMMLAFWDSAEKTVLRVDLWTKKMMVDEMADFYYQSLMTMADNYERATQYKDQADDMRAFAKDFYKKFSKKQEEQQAK